MKFNNIASNDYFRLFVRREGRVVLGKRYSSLWLLCSVLTTTFIAIAFSNASLDYLSYKMNDPFINWVDIKNNFGENDFRGFEEAIRDEEMMTKYHYKSYQTDKYWYTLFCTRDKDSKHLKCRYFADIKTPLVQAIMDDDNVVGGARIDEDKIDNNSFGVIITQDALINKLGYKEIPSYIYYRAYCDEQAASEFYVDLVGDHYAMVPVPVLAVVRRLPTNMDIIGTKFLYLQNLGQSLNLYEDDYHKSLIYYLPQKTNVEKFVADLENATAERTSASYYTLVGDDMPLPRMVNFRPGSFVLLQFDYDDEVDFAVNKQIDDEIMSEYGDDGVFRVYDYNEADSIGDDDDYISVHFTDLDMISEFQEYAKTFKIDIEMSQINAKENFNEVSIMANILSWTMIVFAIVCIIMFIVNLLQSYFQKVKRNLGTFKAFGMGNRNLIGVYVLIMIAMIVAAIFISLGISWFVQESLSIVGLQKDGEFDYLSLWSSKTLYSLIIIVASSVTTVYIVMNKLLKTTPGDLIYDR